MDDISGVSLTQLANNFRSQLPREQADLLANLPILLLCFICHYAHGVATNLAYYFHIPREPLFDIGFVFFAPPTTVDELWSIFIRFILYTITLIFIISRLFTRSSVTMSTIITKVSVVLSISELLRVVTFMSTSFPGPHVFCRPDSPHYSPPAALADIFSPLALPSVFSLSPPTVCGDNVFSAQTMGFVICAFTVAWYCRSFALKLAVWVLAFVASMMLVVLRVHYSLDVFVAWFAVTLVWLAYDAHFPDNVKGDLY